MKMTWEKETLPSSPSKDVASANVDQPSFTDGQSITSARLQDTDNNAFHGASVGDAYKLKSELVAQHLRDLGFGK